jgi:hypothetical protein
MGLTYGKAILILICIVMELDPIWVLQQDAESVFLINGS